MTLMVPDLGSVSFDAQSNLDSTDWAADNGAANGNGVLIGCQVSAQASPNMTVKTSAGTILWQGAMVTVAAVASLTIAAADSFDRVDIVVWTSGTGVQVVKGTDCTTAGWTRTSTGLAPVKPAIPASSVLLGAVYVAASGDPNNGGGATTAIHSANITDKTPSVSGQGVSVTTVSTYSGIDPVANSIATNSFVPSRTTATITVNVCGLVEGPSRWGFMLYYGPSASLVTTATGAPTAGTTVLDVGDIPWDTDGGTASNTFQLTGLTPGTTYYWELVGGPVGYDITYTCGSSSASALGMALSMDESMLAVANAVDNTVALIRRGESRQIRVDPKSNVPLQNLGPFYGETIMDQVIYQIPTGTAPYGVAFSPDGSQLAVASYTSGEVQFFSTTTAALLGSATVAGAFSLTWIGDVVYCGSYSTGNVVPITVSAGTTYTPGSTILTGSVAFQVFSCSNWTTCHLTAPLATVATTTLYVDRIPKALANGDTIKLFSNGTTQSCTVNGAQAATTGPTTITVTSFTPTIAFPTGTGVTDKTTARLYVSVLNTNLYVVSNLTGTPSVATVSSTGIGSGLNGSGGVACTGPGVSPEMVYWVVQNQTNSVYSVLGMTTSNNTIVSSQAVAADPLLIDLWSDGQGAWLTHSPNQSGDVLVSQLSFSSSSVGAGVVVTGLGVSLVPAGQPPPFSAGGTKIVPSSGCMYITFYQGAGAQGIVYEWFNSAFTILPGDFYNYGANVVVSGL